MHQIPNEILMEASMAKSVNPRNRVHWYFPDDLLYRNYICFVIDYLICVDDENRTFKLYIALFSKDFGESIGP